MASPSQRLHEAFEFSRYGFLGTHLNVSPKILSRLKNFWDILSFSRVSLLQDFSEPLTCSCTLWVSKRGMWQGKLARLDLSDFYIMEHCSQLVFYRTHCEKTLIFLLFFFSSSQHLKYLEIPRLGIQLEWQLPTYTTAMATSDLSQICDLCHNSWQHQILSPLSEARDQTCILTGTMLGS